MFGYYYAADGFGLDEREVGFIGDLIGLGGSIVDIAAGGPQKRERAAKAERAAAEANREAAALQLQAAQAQAAAAASAASAASMSRPSVLSAPSLFGLPLWAVILGGLAVVGGGYWLLRDNG